MNSDDINAVHQQIAELVQTLHSGDSHNDAAVAAAIAEHAARVVPGAQHAGVTLVDRRGRISTPACTVRYAVVLDDVQRQHGEGPCLTTARTQRTVHIDDLAHDERFPAFRDAAIAQAPIRSILSLQLSAAGHTIGALNVYADRPRAFTAESVQIGRIYAIHSALAWDNLRRSEQLQRALASRDVIGQAKGMIMERFQTDAAQAFEILKRLSQNNNVAVADIAERMIRSHRENTSRRHNRTAGR